MIQYHGSNDDLYWRIDFRYLDFICIIKHLRSWLIKVCSIEWKCLRLSNFNLRLDLIKTSFFKVLTYLNRSGGKFYIVLKKKSAQSVYFYRFYGHFKFCPKINLHNFCLLNIAVKPVKMVRLSWFFFQNYIKFSPDLMK